MLPSGLRRLAFSCPLPPWPGPAADLGKELLRRWAEGVRWDRVVPVVENPFSGGAGITNHSRIRPIAYMSRLAEEGAVPVYVIDDGDQHVHQLAAASIPPGSSCCCALT